MDLVRARSNEIGEVDKDAKKIKLMRPSLGEDGIDLLALYKSTYLSGIGGNRERVSTAVGPGILDNRTWNSCVGR